MPKIAALILCRWRNSLIFAAGLTGCVVAQPPPFEEFVLARTAVSAAKDVDSAKTTPGLWSRAEENYRIGQKEFKDNDFGPARRHFQAAILYAEKAENATKLKKFQSGDTYP